MDTGDTDHLAIDFEKLYHEEKRKLKEQRLLRRILQQTQAPLNDNRNEDNHDTERHGSTGRYRNHTTTPTIAWDVPIWTWDNTTPLLVQQQEQPCITTTSSFSTAIATFVPNMVHYAKDFVVNASYRDAVIQWLYQLPENNELTSSSSLSSSSLYHHHRHDNTHNTNAVSTDPATAAANGKWTVLPHAQRRVALFDAKQQQQQQQQQQQDRNNTTAHSFPPPLQILIDALIGAGVYNSISDEHHLPNHILINEYVHAHQGILPHTDGPAYHPKTITISFGIGPVLLHFTPMAMNNRDPENDNSNTTKNDDAFQMVLHGNGSLIIFENDAYTKYYHSIHDLSSSSSSSYQPNGTTDSTTQTETTATIEWTGPNCCNTEPGTCIERQPNRISITIRHKLE